MLIRHAATVATINRDARTTFLLQDYFDLSRTTSLLDAMLERGLFQADLVLALLRFRDQHTSHTPVFSDYIARLIGHPIQIGPPCLTQYRAQSLVTHIVRSKDQRRITFVAPTNPRQPQTTPFFQWREYKVGRTIGQVIARGITKRDVRRAIKRQWIMVEEATA